MQTGDRYAARAQAPMPDIPSGKYLGRLLGRQPADEPNTHPLLCCGGWINCRDLGQELGHERHPHSYRIQEAAASAAMALRIYNES
jgi:hypothetical protein